MIVLKLFSTIFGMFALLSLSGAQMTDQSARELAGSVVRSQLHLRPDQFLSVHRNENLEEYLAIATVGWRAGSVFIYNVSQTGTEIKEDAIVRHVATDTEMTYIVAVSSADGSTFRIHGFTDSLAQFEDLMTASKMRASSPEQAESVADFYREANPENLQLTPILNLMDLKQLGERQCQSGAKSFDPGKAFMAWWKHAELSYAALSFEQRVVAQGTGYLVEWIVVSSPSSENCGGAPLRVLLEVSSDGHIGKVTFSSVKTG